MKAIDQTENYKLVSPRRGKIVRGSYYNAFSKEKLGTIPAKIETILVKDPYLNMQKGFNVKSERFPFRNNAFEMESGSSKANIISQSDIKRLNKQINHSQLNNQDNDLNSSNLTTNLTNFSTQRSSFLTKSPIYMYNKQYEKDKNYLEAPNKNSFIKHTFNYKLNPLTNQLPQYLNKNESERFNEDKIIEDIGKYSPGPFEYDSKYKNVSHYVLKSIKYQNIFKESYKENSRNNVFSNTMLQETNRKPEISLNNKSFQNSMNQELNKSFGNSRNNQLNKLSFNNNPSNLFSKAIKRNTVAPKLDKIFSEVKKINRYPFYYQLLKNEEETKLNDNKLFEDDYDYNQNKNNNTVSKINIVLNNNKIEVSSKEALSSKETNKENDYINVNKLKYSILKDPIGPGCYFKTKNINSKNSLNNFFPEGKNANIVFNNREHKLNNRKINKNSSSFILEQFNTTFNKITNVKNDNIRDAKAIDYLIKKELNIPYVNHCKSPSVGDYDNNPSSINLNKGYTIRPEKNVSDYTGLMNNFNNREFDTLDDNSWNTLPEHIQKIRFKKQQRLAYEEEKKMKYLLKKSLHEDTSVFKSKTQKTDFVLNNNPGPAFYHSDI